MYIFGWAKVIVQIKCHCIILIFPVDGVFDDQTEWYVLYHAEMNHAIGTGPVLNYPTMGKTAMEKGLNWIKQHPLLS